MDDLQLVQAMGIPQYAPHVIYLTLTEIHEFRSIRLSDETTMLLDLLSAMNNCDEFKLFLQSLSDVNATVPHDSPFWPGCNVLHLSIMMITETKLWEKLIENLDSQQQLHSLLKAQNPTENDDKRYQERIDICLKSGCDVNVKNAEGLFPIHLAFQLHKKETVQLLLNRCDDSLAHSNFLSSLHIACAIGDIHIVEELLNSGADVNSRTSISFEWSDKSSNLIHVLKNSTALHIATIFQKEEIIKLLLDSGADVNAKNALGFTPIHLLMYPFRDKHHERSIARLLLSRTSNLEESLTDSGLSHLHVAAYANDSKSINKLLRKKANISSIFKVTSPELSYLTQFADKTPLQIAMFKQCHEAVVAFVKNGADLSRRTPELETELQWVLKALHNMPLKKFIQKKYQRRRVDEAIDENGMTLLHIACHIYDYKWAKKLLKKGADVNARVLDDRLPVEDEYCWQGFTPLHFLINKISYTPNGSKRKRDDFVKLLIDYGADLLAINDSQSPMLMAHNLSCKEPSGYELDYEINYVYGNALLPIADQLLENQPSYKINPGDGNGFTHFHYACMRNKVDIVKKFLDNGIDVNHTANVKFKSKWLIDASDFTPLHFAVYYHNVDVARLLIERGADVNAVSGDEETPLHVAIMGRLVDFDLYDMLLNYGADINAPFRSSFRSTPMHAFFQHIDMITHKHVKFFMSRGSSVENIHRFNSGPFGLAMAKAKPSDREAIFEELSVFCDVKNLVEYGYNAIEDIVAVNSDGRLTVSFYLSAIQRLVDKGCDLDQKNEKGETALHNATSYDNVEAVEALLLLGANINIIDNDNNYPIHTFPNSYINRTQKILAAHVWKMKFVGLKVLQVCETVMLNIHEVFPLDEGFKSRCEEELAELSKEKIGQSLNMRSFLREWSPAMDYPTMSFVQKEKIVKFFAKAEDLRSKYPLFWGLLMVQYRKVIARVRMYEIAMNTLLDVLQVDLPVLCLDNILKYLDNDEMKCLIDY